jgi:hypothetical protein
MNKRSREVTLRAGESTSVPLAGSAGGFRWRHRVLGDAGTVDVTVDYADGPIVPGTWRGEVVTLTGRRPGRAEVRLAQRRPWEPALEGAADPSDNVIDVTVLDR